MGPGEETRLTTHPLDPLVGEEKGEEWGGGEEAGSGDL